MSCWYILEINPLSVVSFVIISSHSEGCLFHLAYSFLCYAKAFKFNQITFVYFCFYFHYSRRWVWRRQWHPTTVLLPRKSHGRRSLVGCSPWCRQESDSTEWLHFHFSLSCIGEGNDNPLQCFWLENPRDGGAWWAAIYGVSQSWTRLKRLSSSSSSRWVIEELALVYVIKCSAYVFL